MTFIGSYSVPMPTTEQMAKAKDRDFRDALTQSLRETAESWRDFARACWSEDVLRSCAFGPIGPGSRKEKEYRRRMRREARAEMALRAAGDYPRFQMWGRQP